MFIKNLPEPYKTIALYEAEKQGKKPNENSTLMNSFTWGDTQERFSFWNNIDNEQFDDSEKLQLMLNHKQLFKKELLKYKIICL